MHRGWLLDRRSTEGYRHGVGFDTNYAARMRQSTKEEKNMRLVSHYFSFTLWPDCASCGAIEKYPGGQLVRSVGIEVCLSLFPGGVRLNYMHDKMVDFALYDVDEENLATLSVHLQLPKLLEQLTDVRAAKGNAMLHTLRHNPGAIHRALAPVRPAEPPGETENPWQDGFYFVYELRPESVQSPRSHIIAPASMHELLNTAEATVSYLTDRFRELYALDPKDELMLSQT